MKTGNVGSGKIYAKNNIIKIKAGIESKQLYFTNKLKN